MQTIGKEAEGLCIACIGTCNSKKTNRFAYKCLLMTYSYNYLVWPKCLPFRLMHFYPINFYVQHDFKSQHVIIITKNIWIFNRKYITYATVIGLNFTMQWKFVYSYPVTRTCFLLISFSFECHQTEHKCKL